MGSTTYVGKNAQEAIAYELSGTEVLAKSGNWYMWRNEHGYIGLTYFITRKDSYRYGTNVKGVDITMGPNVTPPVRIAREYVAAYGGDIDTAGGKYGARILRKAITPCDDCGVRAGVKCLPHCSTYFA